MTIIIDKESVELDPKPMASFIGILFNAFLDASNIHMFDDEGLQVRVKLEVEDD